jgi:hypothetical protein
MCTYLAATNPSRRMGEEIGQERCVIYRCEYRVSGAYTTLWRILNSWPDKILRYGTGRRGSPSDSRPLRRRPRRRGTRQSPRKSARCAERPSITTNSNARPRRGSGHPNSNTSSLGIKLRLQVPSYHTVSTSTGILHGLILIISIRGALQSVSHGLALRKAIRTATTTLARHL